MKAIALIAHDGKKTELGMFATRFQEFFAGVPVVATSTTGAMLEKLSLIHI